MKTTRSGLFRIVGAHVLLAAGWIACGGSVESATVGGTDSSDGGATSNKADDAEPAPTTTTQADAAVKVRDGGTNFPTFDGGTTMCGEYAAPDVLERFAKAGALALYEVIASGMECTNLGGESVVFRPMSGCGFGRHAVLWGGHGCMTQRLWKQGDLAVLAVEPASVPAPPSGICLDSLPAADGIARGMQPVNSITEGAMLLAKYGCTP